MNSVNLDQLKEIIKNAKLYLSVLPDMTTLRNNLEKLGILGFAIFEEGYYIAWKKEGEKYLITNKIEIKKGINVIDGYLHHVFHSEAITLKEFLKKNGRN